MDGEATWVSEDQVDLLPKSEVEEARIADTEDDDDLLEDLFESHTKSKEDIGSAEAGKEAIPLETKGQKGTRNTSLVPDAVHRPLLFAAPPENGETIFSFLSLPAEIIRVVLEYLL